MFDKKIENIAMLLVVGLILITIVSIVSDNNSNDIDETINVAGSSEVITQPDQAKMYVSIVSLEDTAVRSQERNAELSNEVIVALESEGVKSEDIETQNYYMYQRTEWDDETRKSRPVGYQVEHTLEITTTNLEKVGDYLDIAVNAGANEVDRVTFSLTKEKQQEINSEALSLAAENAEAKAKSLAKDLDVKVGKVVRVSESNTMSTPYEYYPRMDMAVAEAGSAKTSIQPSDVTVRAYLSLAYEIE